MDEQFVNELAKALRKVGTIHTVGEEWVSYIGEIPVGGVPYCGQMCTRSTYSALWSYAQSKGLVKTEAEWQQIANANGGNVPYYSSGDGSTTFRMPKMVGYVKGASSQSVAGDYVAEGLPNITGTFKLTRGDDIPARAHSGTGAFYVDSSTETTIMDNSLFGGISNGTMGLDASRSNSIYGNSDHVTPETSTVMFGVYAFGAIVETGSLDATTLATGLATLESNVNAHIRVVETWSNGTEWYRKWSDGWIEQGGWQGSTSTNATVTLNTPFTTTNYTVTAVAYSGEGVPRLDTLTTTKFQWQPSGSTCTGYWYACGY